MNWVNDIRGFLDYLRWRGWKYPFVIFGGNPHPMHMPGPHYAANDNGRLS